MITTRKKTYREVITHERDVAPSTQRVLAAGFSKGGVGQILLLGACVRIEEV